MNYTAVHRLGWTVALLIIAALSIVLCYESVERRQQNQYILTQAAIAGDTRVIQTVLENGADVDGRDNEDRTPLMNAALNGQIAATILLIAKGADVNATANGNETPLSLAQITRSSRDETRVLKEAGAKPAEGGE